MKRREFLEKLAIAGGIAMCSPLKIAHLMGKDDLPYAMQQLLDWGPYEADASALPQYFTITSPVEVAFRDAAALNANSGSAGRSATTSQAIVHPTIGTSTIAAAPGQASGNIRVDRVGTWSWSNQQAIAVLFYVADTTNLASITIYTSSQNPVTTKFMSVSQSGGGLTNGWNLLYKTRSQMTANGGEVFTDPILSVMLRCDSNASGDVTVNWNSFWFLGQKRPKHVWWFDDGFDGVYTIAYPYLSARGIKGSLAICRDLIGQANYMTLPQIQELYAAGWPIINHTTNHTNLTTLSTAQEILNIIQPNEVWLRNTVGVKDGFDWFVPPQGGMNTLAASVCAGLGYQYIRGATTAEGTLHSSFLGSVHAPPKTLIPSRATDAAFALASWKGELQTNISYGATYHSYNHRPVASGAAGAQVDAASIQSIADECYRTQAFDTISCLQWAKQAVNGRRSK